MTIEPDGTREAPVKFEHAADTAWSELWQDWQRCEIEVDQAGDAADAAVDTLPEWAKEVRRKRAGYENKPPDTPEARAAAELDTPEYRTARSGLDAAKQRYSDLGDAQTEVEERILATPAHTAAGVLVKLRIGTRETILNYLDSDSRMPEESEIGMYCRMLLAALADLESLAGSDIGPDKVDLRRGRTKIAHLYKQALGFYEQGRKAADRDDGHAADRIHESFGEVRELIMETPATCPQDVAIKLRLFANIMDIVDRPETLPEMSDNAAEGYLRTAICDLERLGGKGLTGAGVGPCETALRQDHAETHQVTQAGLDEMARKEDEKLLSDLDQLEAARGKFVAFMKQRGGLGREIEALQGRIVEVRPDTFVGAKRMLLMAHTILSVRDVDPGVFLGSGPATAVIAQVISALDDKDGSLDRRDAW